jgi:hypothetical protein
MVFTVLVRILASCQVRISRCRCCASEAHDPLFYCTGPSPSRGRIARRYLGIQPHISIHHKFRRASLNLTRNSATATADHYHCFFHSPSPSAASCAAASDAYPESRKLLIAAGDGEGEGPNVKTGGSRRFLVRHLILTGSAFHPLFFIFWPRSSLTCCLFHQSLA